MNDDIEKVRKGINGSFRDRINAHAALKRIEKRMNDSLISFIRMSDECTVYLGWKEEMIPTLQRQRDTARERADALADALRLIAKVDIKGWGWRARMAANALARREEEVK